MALEDIVDVQIDLQTASISRVGFGTPMFMSSEADSLLTTTAKVYGSDITELTADGFDVNGVVGKKFTQVIAQNPKVSRIVVGKRSLLPLKTLTITPIAKNDTAYTITIGGVGPTSTSPVEVFTFTSDATATVAEITAGLVLAINGGTQKVLATDNTTDITIERADTPAGSATAGSVYRLLVNDRTLLEVQNITADPGVATDYGTIRTAVDGNDDWYAVMLDNSGEAEILALAAAVETTEKIFLAATSDADALTASTTDVGSVLKSNNYARTSTVWHADPDNGPEAGWGGNTLPTDPGSITWNLRRGITGVPASSFSTAELTEIKNKNLNRFVEIAGLTVPQEGKMAGGTFNDLIRGIDFITQRIREDTFRQLVLLPKIPFTDPGIAVIEAILRGVSDLGIAQGIFVADPAPLIQVPLAAEVDANDKAQRRLATVTFSAVLAGAIHEVVYRGTVTV
jgi:hypothetical protein